MSEYIDLSRACEAIEIPSGNRIILPMGTPLHITQSLGGSYTISTLQGNLYRIEEQNKDALGIQESAKPAEAVAEMSLEQKVWRELRNVFDPEIPVNIADLGLIYSCVIKPLPDDLNRVEIMMTLTAPGCGMSDVIKADVERRLSNLPTVKEVNVEVSFDPPWNPGLMSEAAKLQLGLDLDVEPSAPSFPMVRSTR